MRVLLPFPPRSPPRTMMASTGEQAGRRETTRLAGTGSPAFRVRRRLRPERSVRSRVPKFVTVGVVVLDQHAPDPPSSLVSTLTACLGPVP